jgi:transcriptional regulator with XRE-family HTH domain
MTPQQNSERLKELRLRAGLTTRDVQSLSRKIADSRRNPRFVVSHGWLTNIENSGLIPSIHKLYSLSVMYRCSYVDLLRIYDIDPRDVARDQILIGSPSRTQLFKRAAEEVPERIKLPVRFDPGRDLKRPTCCTGWFKLGVCFLSLFSSIWICNISFTVTSASKITRCIRSSSRGSAGERAALHELRRLPDSRL